VQAARQLRFCVRHLKPGLQQFVNGPEHVQGLCLKTLVASLPGGGQILVEAVFPVVQGGLGQIQNLGDGGDGIELGV